MKELPPDNCNQGGSKNMLLQCKSMTIPEVHNNKQKAGIFVSYEVLKAFYIAFNQCPYFQALTIPACTSASDNLTRMEAATSPSVTIDA